MHKYNYVLHNIEGKNNISHPQNSIALVNTTTVLLINFKTGKKEMQKVKQEMEELIKVKM